jgi:acetate kinase
MSAATLVLNAGSSSLKFSLFKHGAHGPELIQRGQLDGLTTKSRFDAKSAAGATLGHRTWDHALGHDGALAFLLEYLAADALRAHPLRAVGHRVVHGGLHFARPVVVDDSILLQLQRLIPLAPLHQPHNLAAIAALLDMKPGLPQVACFDTAFHRTQSELEQAYALPPSITAHGIQRYGFHGLSYEYIASVLPGVDAAAARGRTVVAHLGNGASMCAMLNGHSVASTMGFSTVDGLMMGTRSGALDPGILIYLMDELKMDVRAIEDLIYRQSGLLGVSGLSSDMRTLQASSDPRARFAIELFCYRIGRELGSLVAALGGLDALVFTGGIGEHGASIREKVVGAAGWLGLGLDAPANARNGPRISKAGAVSAWVIPTDEERMIARHTDALIDGRTG